RSLAICRFIGRAIRSEPFALWQFVLSPSAEEPLDLLEAMIAEIDKVPPGYLDRSMVATGSRASRRILILLRPGVRYDREWIDAVEGLLGQEFH
ncbi:MAG: hypothetical protein WCN95_13850, partial [bacterium]